MKIKAVKIAILFLIATQSCAAQNGTDSASPAGKTFTASSAIPATDTFTPPPTITPAPTDTPLRTDTPTVTPIPTVASINASVTADKLSCRYGPGAEYLYLFAFNATAKITLIGRTDANNWVWVENTDDQNRSANCWVNKKFLEIQGDPTLLPIVYPGLKLPVSPYYPGPRWAKAERRKDGKIVITWEEVKISPGKYEDEFMHQYIIEVWRCEGGQILFETLGTNFPFITVEKDEPGCPVPSHGRVFVQEKHGYGGPVEIPWPSQ